MNLVEWRWKHGHWSHQTPCRSVIAEIPSFRAQFAAVRAGVALRKRHDAAEWRKQEVRADRSVGLRCVLRASFIEQHVFKGVCRILPADIHLSTLSLRGPDGEVMEGVLAKAGTVPGHIAHFDVECFTSTCRVHSDWLLCSEDQHRSEQASERMTLATRNMAQNTMISKFTKCQDYDTIQKHAEQFQQEQQQTEKCKAEQEDPAASEAKLHIRSRLTDEPEAPMLPPPTAKSKGKPNAKTKAKAKAGAAAKQPLAASVRKGQWSSAASSVASVTTRRSSRQGGSSAGDNDEVFALNSAEGDKKDPFMEELQSILGGAQLGREMRSVPRLAA